MSNTPFNAFAQSFFFMNADSRSVADIQSAHPNQFLLLLRPNKHGRALEREAQEILTYQIGLFKMNFYAPLVLPFRCIRTGGFAGSSGWGYAQAVTRSCKRA
jgi:hypothetical protein